MTEDRSQLLVELLRQGYLQASADGVVYKNGEVVTTQDKHGYVVVRIFKYSFFAHQIIWTQHNGVIPPGFVLNHLDGSRTNNALSNLELVTQRQNYLHGRANTRTITPEQVKEAKRRLRSGEKLVTISKEFGVSASTLSKYVNGKKPIWEYVPGSLFARRLG